MNTTDTAPGAVGAGTPRAQAAPRVLMVRPASFGWNAETQPSNLFQRADPALAADAQSRAVAEFDALVDALRAAQVEVVVVQDEAPPACPDAVFPNNWVSLHADGTVVLYPMLAPSRRRERRLEHVWQLEQAAGLRVTRIIDLTHHEMRGQFLEGTGSVVFDHVGRVAYASLSPRTHAAPLAELCDELGYAPCTFDAADATGAAIYHTNVMLAIGTTFAVVAGATIDAPHRAAVLDRLADTGREVIAIDLDAMARYAGNVLELRARDEARVLAMSAAAEQAFGPARLDALRRHVERIVSVPVPTIETLGGGSVRCMLAEVFLQ